MKVNEHYKSHHYLCQKEHATSQTPTFTVTHASNLMEYQLNNQPALCGLGGVLMADARYKHGVYQGFDPNRQTKQVDSPLLHGWKRTDLTENGHALFELGDAQIRTTGPEDNCQFEWIVYVGDEAYGFDGALAEITNEVCKMLGIAVPRPQAFFMAETVIPATAFGGE